MRRSNVGTIGTPVAGEEGNGTIGTLATQGEEEEWRQELGIESEDFTWRVGVPKACLSADGAPVRGVDGHASVSARVLAGRAHRLSLSLRRWAHRLSLRR